MTPAFEFRNLRDYFYNISDKHKNAKTKDYISELIWTRNLSEFLTLKGQPKKFLIDYIHSNMISLQTTGPIYFRLIFFKDHADLYAEYNSIIGQRLIGRIDNSSIPLYGRSV